MSSAVHSLPPGQLVAAPTAQEVWALEKWITLKIFIRYQVWTICTAALALVAL